MELYQKETPTQFSREICEIFKNTFFTEHFRWLLLEMVRHFSPFFHFFDIMEQRFRLLLQKYEENLQNKMRGSDFEFDGVNFLYHDFNKISLNRGGSYIDSRKWLKDKKSTINPKNNDNKCFQYAVTLALNLDRIKKDPQRISKIKPFIDQYNWTDIEFLSNSKDWRKFALNNKVALNILYIPHNTKKYNLLINRNII